MRICYPAIAAMLLSLVLPLEAKTILFPQDDPVFTMKIPDGWKMAVDKDGDISCDSGEHIGVQFRLNKLNLPFAKAKASLPELGKVFSNAAKLTEIETKEMGDDTNKNGVKGTIFIVKGKSSGRLFTAELLAVEPKPGANAYFILFSGLAEALNAHKDDIGTIIDSIKAVD